MPREKNIEVRLKYQTLDERQSAVKVIIIHGAYGNPKENWFPWLKNELEKLGCRVFIPKFPTPKNQSLNNWLKVFRNYRQYLDENSILIGHSIGSAFILSILEKLNHQIKAAFLIAGWVGPLGLKKFDSINKTICEKDFNWNKIKQNCRRFYIYNSDNDPYVPIEKGRKLAKKLGIKLKIIKNAGHFNKNAGYIKFELLLRSIKRII